jgi:hypothetical protein
MWHAILVKAKIELNDILVCKNIKTLKLFDHLTPYMLDTALIRILWV